MVKTSKIVWYAGIVSVVVSGALNVIFLVETLREVTIQVPSHTLQPYETITANDVTTKQVPIKVLDADTLTGNLIGKITATMIPQGDQIQSFEIAEQGSMAQVIQNLYLTHPNYAFAQIQVQATGLNQTIQSEQKVNFFANNITYPNVLVLSITSPNNPTGLSNAVNRAVNNFVSVTPTTTPSVGTLTLLIGAPWPTVQALMSSGNIQVVMGNVGAQYTLGSPPVNQDVPFIPSASVPSQVSNQATKKEGATHAK